MDKLQAMQVFVRVAEAGSFSAVARELSTSQSAVSKQVAALERVIGARLLSRTTRSIALTEEGENYLEQARRLVAEIAEAESAARTGQDKLSGLIHVAAAVGFGRLKLMPIVQEFLRLHPDVRINLRLADGFVDLVEQGIDLAVRVGKLEDSSLIARRIGSTSRQLVIHRDLHRRMQTEGPAPPAHPDELLHHDCLVYTELATRDQWTFIAGPDAAEPAGTVRTVRVSGRLQTNSGEVIRAAVLAGMGLGYSPDWLFEDALARGDVVRLMPAWQAPPLPIQLVSPPQRQRSAKVRSLAEFIANALGCRMPQPPADLIAGTRPSR